ncbi:hypothetical protein LTR96_006332 [Exophiala xenobiotica]|nr:hypothetical protein LTR92_009721 [Exophiala xenobiotica]KAK5205024.1 hypothetical protein LTR41_009234 [Exophiala xenobiotica]KAK5220153.1 hypothetical protein LTR72_007684 [Exophiala xenobiotica]KAK5268625.1 hypothetical protein LTR96_006332 [Exophiala xenobiotica]KAK5292968.1 hypothetical protein LTR14_005317 [Exophiala xenobiotica]
MKISSFQTATLFSSLATAALLSSPPTTTDSAPKDIETVAGTTGPDHISIHFRAPCQGCFIGTDDGLELTLEIDAAEEECSSSPPRLNGLPLVLTKGNDVGHGQISFKSKASNGLGEKEIHATWESTCLKGQASIVSVRFDDIAGQSHVKGSSGFTTSFKQKGKPTVLRLQDKPLGRISSDDICDEWLLPEDQTLSVIPVMADPVPSLDTLLQIEYLKLESLTSEMADLHDQIRGTEGKIVSILKQDFKTCSTMKCLWQTAIKKAPAIKQLIAAHFSHHKHHRDGCKEGESQTTCSTKTAEEVVDSSPLPPSQTHAHADEVQVDQNAAPSAATTRSLPTPTADPVPANGPENHEDLTSPPPPPPVAESEAEQESHPRPQFEESSKDPVHPHHPPFEFDEPGEHGPPHHPPWFDPEDKEHPHHPPWFDGPGGEDHPPPPPDGPPPFHGRPPFDGPPHPHFGPPHGPPPGHHGPPPWAPGSHGGPPDRHHGRPHGPPRPGLLGPDGRRSLEYKLTSAVLSLLLLVIVSAVLFKLIRTKTSWYRDPRRQAERAARREERRTKKLYRKAACKHKFSTWWKRYQTKPTDDYEEKRQMILEQEGILEDVMQNEIRNLQVQSASDFVRDIIRAEEGRVRSDHRGHVYENGYSRAYTPAELEAGVGSSRLSDIPPSYSAPPAYEEELAGELTVVDGFRYTPSNTDDTPESSVVDCSPRLSFETGRSTILTKDARG